MAYPITLNGDEYLVDTAIGIKQRSVPILRPQSDTSSEPGSQSLNPEALWRRVQDTWHKGAGQVHLDRSESDPARFRDSHGVDPWTKWALSLLPATAVKYASSSTTGRMHMAVAGGYLYIGIDTTLAFTADITVASPTWTTVSTATIGFIDALASDGNTIYMAPAAGGGVYTTAAGSGTIPTLYNSQNASVIDYVKGRLMIASSRDVYNLTSGGPPTLLYQQPVAGFIFVAFAEGPNYIYAGGFVGDKSLIYKTQIKTDASALDALTPAGELPDGEVIRSMQGYLGFMCVGTDLGLRLATIDADGNLTFGALIETASPVRCFEGQDRFVWYGNTNQTGTATGLGRFDLSVFTSPLVPAYANDLTLTGQGTVRDVVTFQGLRVFAVDGFGIYAETTDKVVSGTLDTGEITYGLSETKNALYASASFSSLPAGSSDTLSLSVDGGAFSSVGTPTIASPRLTISPAKTGERFEMRHTLTRATVTSQGPVLTRHMLEVQPAPSRTITHVVPLVIAAAFDDDSKTYDMDINARLASLSALVASGIPVPYVSPGVSANVVVEDFEFAPHHVTDDDSAWNGTCTVKLQEHR